MNTTKKVTVKKSLEQQILDAEKKLALLKAKKSELTKDSPGIAALLVAAKEVTEKNDCKIADVVEALARIKKTGQKIERVIKPRKSKATKTTQ